MESRGGGLERSGRSSRRPTGTMCFEESDKSPVNGEQSTPPSAAGTRLSSEALQLLASCREPSLAPVSWDQVVTHLAGISARQDSLEKLVVQELGSIRERLDCLNVGLRSGGRNRHAHEEESKEEEDEKQ